jgi:hypothetical protein
MRIVGILAQTSDTEDRLFFCEAAGLAVSLKEVCSGVDVWGFCESFHHQPPAYLASAVILSGRNPDQ